MARLPKNFPLKKHKNCFYLYMKGKVRYFGSTADPEAALREYHRRYDDIMSGREDDRKAANAHEATVLDVATAYLAHREKDVDDGNLIVTTLSDFRIILRQFLEAVGAHRRVAELTPDDFQKAREALHDGCKLDRLRRKMKRVQMAFTWAAKMKIIETLPDYGPAFDAPPRGAVAREKDNRQHVFTAEQIWKLIKMANVRHPAQWRAIVFMAINCAYGSRDISVLRLKDVDLRTGWATLPRTKTGNRRRAKLWPETVEAIRHYMVTERLGIDSDLLFLNSAGERWSYVKGTTRVDTLGRNFRKVCKKLEIPETSFYTLRRTFRTVADEVCDNPAVDLIMGHKDPTMGGVYRQYISDKRLFRVAKYVRKWLKRGE